MIASKLMRRAQTTFLVLLLAVTGLAAEVSAASLTQEQQSAVSAIAASLAPVPDRADMVLTKLGFTVIARTLPGYKDWPALRKVEAAYRAAVESGEQAEGTRFLRAAVKVIAEDHTAAILHEPSLQAFAVPEAAGAAAKPIAFRRPAVVGATAPTPVLRDTLLALERYVELVPGGMQGVMGRCCGNSPDFVYEILSTAPSRKEALIRAVIEGNLPPELKARLLRAIELVWERTHAVNFEPALAPYLDELDRAANRPSADDHIVSTLAPEVQREEGKLAETVDKAAHTARVDKATVERAVLLATTLGATLPEGPPPAQRPSSTPPAPGGPGSDGPISPEATTTPGPSGPPNSGGGAGENFKAFRSVQSSVPEGAARSASPLPSVPGLPAVPRFSFSSMRVSAAGPGGVLFGNQVEAPGVPKPTELIWVAERTADTVKPTTWGHFDVVLGTQQVAMTRRMRTEDAYAAWHIVTGDKDLPPMDLTQQEGIGLASVVRGSAAMMVHPAIYGLALGDAAALADKLGYAMPPEAMQRHFEAVDIPKPAIARALKWQAADNGWYKILDAPLSIRLNDGMITVERTPDPNVPELLRRVAFLDFEAIDDDGESHDNPDFYPSVPALVAAFPAFERLNSFAETFAVVRWAKASGARLVPPVAPQSGPAHLFITSLPNGELAATETVLSPSQETALSIQALDLDGQSVTDFLRKAHAPRDATTQLYRMIEAKQQAIRVRVAQTQLERAALKDKAQGEKLRPIIDELDKQLSALQTQVQEFADKDTIAALFASPQISAKLSFTLTKRRAAMKQMNQNEDAVDAFDDEDARLQSLSPDNRTHALKLQQAAANAFDDLQDALEGPAHDLARARAERAQAAFEASLPPIDQQARTAAVNKLEAARNDVQQIEHEYAELLDASMPAWLKQTWQPLRDFALRDY